MTKNWTVTFKFSQAAASRYWQSAEVEAYNFGMAVNRAWAIVKTRQGIKGKRLTQATISVERHGND